MCEFVGAIDVETNKFTLPTYLNKEDKKRNYQCIICDEKLMLKIGEIKAKHFSHYSKSKCILNTSNHIGESKEHLSAKLKLFYLLKNKTPIKILVECPYNHTVNYKNIEIKYEDEDDIIIEYNSKGFVADIAVVSSLTNQIKYIFEICHSHKTDDKTKILRPEPWFEIKAEEILNFGKEIEIKSKPLIKNLLSPEKIKQLELIEKKNNEKDNEKANESKVIEKNNSLTCIRKIDFDENKTNKVYRFCDICLELNEHWVDKIPRLNKKHGFEKSWKQELPCIYCDNITYSPYFNKVYLQVCKICIYSNIGKIKGIVNTKTLNV
jgi:competence CoiA-like predicted nuclease